MTFYRIYAGILGTIFALSALIFSRHISTDAPEMYVWSMEYLGSMAALAALAVFQFCYAFWPRTFSYGWIGNLPVRWALTLNLLACIHYAVSQPPQGNFSLHSEFLLPVCAILLATQLWTAASKSGLLACAANCFAVVILFLVIFELQIVAEPRISYTYSSWGDRFTFLYLHRKQEPLIGYGGRLYPWRSLLLATVGEKAARGVSFKTNSHGFRNSSDVALAKAPDELRVLSLGDSFFGGDGVGQDDFVGAALQRELQKFTSKTVTVLNAEVSDPALGLWYLQKYALEFKPDAVIYGFFSGNDLIQTHFLTAPPSAQYTLGPNGTLNLNPSFDDVKIKYAFEELNSSHPYRAQRTQPEPARAPGLTQRIADNFPYRSLAHFRLPALILGGELAARYNGQGEWLPSYTAAYEASGQKQLFDTATSPWLFYKEPLAEAEAAYASAFAVLNAQNALLKRAGVNYVLFFVPLRLQVQAEDWKIFRSTWNLNEADFDLLLPNRKVRDFCANSGITLVDPTEDFRKAAADQSLYLAHDSHWNEAGHALAAQALAQHLVPLVQK